ncbi:hypothetical protein H8959_001365 [Pygathrix nigripes]
MSAYYRNNGSEEDPDYPDYSGSQNHTQGYLKTQGYPDVPSPLNNPYYPGTRSNPYSVASRTRPDYPESLAEPNYPGSLSNPDYSGTRSNAYSAASRTSPYHPTSLPEPDYSEFQSHPYHRASSRQPDYLGSQRNPDFAGSSSSGNYAGSRTHPDHFGSLEPDYPGAQSNSDHPGPRANLNHPGSRRNLEHTSFRINPFTDSLGKPDYPGADVQPNSPPFFGEPDYPGAEDNQNLPSTWREPDYSDAENGHDYGSSETPKMTRGALSRTSSIRPSFHHRSDGPLSNLWGENEDYPEGIEMASMEMANSYGHSLPGAPGNGYGQSLQPLAITCSVSPHPDKVFTPSGQPIFIYVPSKALGMSSVVRLIGNVSFLSPPVNPAYVGESGPVHAYGNPPLSENDWHKNPGRRGVPKRQRVLPRQNSLQENTLPPEKNSSGVRCRELCCDLCRAGFGELILAFKKNM